MKAKRLRSWISIGWLVAAVLWGMPAHARDFKIGVVDMSRLFKDYYRTAQAKTRIETMRKDMQKEKDALEEDFKRLTEEYNKTREEADSVALSEEVRQQKRKLSEEKLKDLQLQKNKYEDFIRKGSNLMQERQAGEREKILKEITDEIQQVAREENYDFVFDRSGQNLSGLPSLLFGKEEFDITETLMKRLNAKAPSSPLPEEKAPETKPTDKDSAPKKPSSESAPK